MTKKTNKIPTLKQVRQMVARLDREITQAEIAANKANALLENLETDYTDAEDFVYFVDQHDSILKAKKPLLDPRGQYDMWYTLQGKRYAFKRIPGTYWSTGERNEYGGIVEPMFSAMNPKGAVKTKLPHALAMKWAAGKPLTEAAHAKGVDIAKLNQAIAKAGYKVVKQ